MTDHARTPADRPHRSSRTRPPDARPARAVLPTRGPADLVAAVPYLLGFHPTDSLTVLGLEHSGGTRYRTGPVARVDLPPPGLEEAAVASVLQRLLAVPEVAALHVLVHRDTPVPGDEAVGGSAAGRQDAALLAAVRAWCAGHRGPLAGPVLLLDALRVAEGRWTSLLCADPACCPPEGTSVLAPADPDGPALIGATAALAGVAPLPDRAAVVAGLAAVDDLPSRLVAAALRTRAAALHTGAAALHTGPAALHTGAAALAEPVPSVAGPAAVAAFDRALAATSAGTAVPGASETAALLALLRAVPGRDAVLAAVLALPPEAEAAARALLAHLVRRAPAGFAAPPAAVLAAVALAAGGGALCRVAVDRALAEEPDCRLALLVDAACDRGVRPEQVRAALLGRTPAGRRRRRRAS